MKRAIRKFKPCPFCGFQKSRIVKYDGDVWRTCDYCKASTGPQMFSYQANRAWEDRSHWTDKHHKALAEAGIAEGEVGK